MATMRWTAVSGSVALLLATLVGCNKQTDGTPATGSAVSPGNQTAPEMMGPGTHDGQGTTMGGPGMHGTDHHPAPAMSGQSGQTMSGPSVSGPMMDSMRANCPMVVADADVKVEDSDKGVTLTFTTEKGDVADLRARVDHLAQMYAMHPAGGSMMWHQMGEGHGMGMGHGAGMMGHDTGTGMMGAGGRHGMGGGMMGDGDGMGSMPPAKATVETIAKGARLVLTPTNGSELAALRSHARLHQQHMQSGQCWMSNAPSSGTASASPKAK
jgi:hypothetical protein